MAQQVAVYKIKGTAPLIPHNGRLADPTYKFSRAMKEISGKRNKTEADLLELARLEWFGALYAEDGKLVIPAYVIEAGLIAASKKQRQGQLSQAGMFVNKNSLLIYPDMDKTLDELWEMDDYRFSIGVRIQRAKIMRMRPIFNTWETELNMTFEDSIVNKKDVDTWVKICGEQVGLCDWRPRYGRFELA